MQYTLNLVAGQDLRQEFTGRTLVILSIVGAASINMDVEMSGFATERLRGIKAGARLRSGVGFTSAVFRSNTNCVLEVVATDADLSVNMIDNATVQAQIVGQPVAVVNDRGAPGNPVNVVGITYADAPATGVVNNAPVACGPVIAQLIAASATRRHARFCNLGPNPVTLGPAGHTWARRCIVLEVGDVWIEERAANLGWFGITDAGGAASVTVQEVNA